MNRQASMINYWWNKLESERADKNQYKYYGEMQQRLAFEKLDLVNILHFGLKNY